MSLKPTITPLCKQGVRGSSPLGSTEETARQPAVSSFRNWFLAR